MCYNDDLQEISMKRNVDEIMSDFVRMACALSPENLWCDGEASSDEVDEKLKRINGIWETLENEIGYKVTEEDAWNWSSRNQRTTKKQI